MQSDEPPRITERSISRGSEAGSRGPLHQNIVMVKHHQPPPSSSIVDQSPIKPARRRGWSDGGAGESKTEHSETDSITYDLLTGESSEGGSSDFSDITDPTAFNGSMSQLIDGSWRQDSLDVSARIDALGPLEEEQNEIDLSELFLVSSSRDRSVFESEGNDVPPQLASRRPRSCSSEWSEPSDPVMECRFQKMAPDDHGKPMKPPSYSQRVAVPSARSALPKLAEVFKSGCATGTHTYHLKKYQNVFVGSEAVDFMLRTNLAPTRLDAVFLGQRFCKELSLFHHVCWDHTFRDGLYFYRFNDGSTTPISKEDLVRMSESFVEGMPVSNHMKRRFKTFEDTFLGDEAVNYMLQANMASSRSDAVFLGQRMMEEFEIFEPVAHNSRFKDTCYLYRFVAEKIEALANYSSNFLSPVERSGSQELIEPNPLPATSYGECKENSKISFGLVQIRCFERCLDVNPATEKGPSLGLGWRFYDDSPVPLGDEKSETLDLRRQAPLSSKQRKAILKAWGYSKAEISRGKRANKTIRNQRKRSLND